MDYNSLGTAPVLLVYMGKTSNDIIWHILLKRARGIFCNPVLKSHTSSQ